MSIPDERGVIPRLLGWAEGKSDIRAVLLTSSRARPGAELDGFSDYDVILVAKDIRPYLDDESWLEAYGKVMVVYRDPVQVEYGFERFIRVTYYRDYSRIDYTIWPVGLLDKDNLTRGMKPPTCTAYIPSPPSEQEYRRAIETFFSDATYVAKALRRDDLFLAKHCLDQIMKFKYLRLMLEWLMEIENGWKLKTGAYGKGLKKLTRPELWAELESTYTGAGKEENWEALFRTIALFRKTAKEVGTKMGFAYPQELDNNVVKYLDDVRNERIP
ncbi:MAG: aminoglycoside 6-adenylyltransferase [Dehalococcoidales bacterium]|jgi:aminoglycoside 6-adenylyltransferase